MEGHAPASRQGLANGGLSSVAALGRLTRSRCLSALGSKGWTRQAAQVSVVNIGGCGCPSIDFQQGRGLGMTIRVNAGVRASYAGLFLCTIDAPERGELLGGIEWVGITDRTRRNFRPRTCSALSPTWLRPPTVLGSGLTGPQRQASAERPLIGATARFGIAPLVRNWSRIVGPQGQRWTGVGGGCHRQ